MAHAEPVRPKKLEITVVADNRRARFEYSILEEIEAGIVLTGTEVKSLRAGKAMISDGYARIDRGELWMENVHIGHFKQGNIFNHEEKRKRKLLVHARELEKLEVKTKDTGVTIVVLRLYFKGSHAKALLGVARGKHAYDKRAAIKERDVKRELRNEE